MTDQTPNLRLPYMMAAQAQKHVTHNEAIRALDALVQISVASHVTASPPAGPVEGERRIVGTGATGAFAGQTGKIAAWQDGAWAFLAPREGWLAWVADEDRLYAFDGTGWTGASPDISLNPAPLVGVNATADTTDRLAVNSPASLFTGGDGGHRMKINKAGVSDTASQIYQVGYSGRAETGLTGDNDFHFKVSPDGAAWKEALVLSSATGAPRLPTFPVASLPSAATAGVGATILVANGSADPVLATSDGANWRRVEDRSLVTASIVAATSTTSNTIGAGAKTFTVPSGLALAAGQRVRAAYDAANWMEGDIASYAGGTLVVTVTTTRGSGAFALWAIGPATAGAAGSGAAGYGGTSSSSVSIGTGTKQWTVQAGLAYVVGQRVRVAEASGANYVEGVISGYNSGTGLLTVAIDTAVGSGVFTSWSVGVAGQPGSSGSIAGSVLSDIAMLKGIALYTHKTDIDPTIIAAVPYAKSMKVVFDGDSITAGNGATTFLRGTTASNWASLYLASNTDGRVGGVNLAVGGSKLYDLVARRAAVKAQVDPAYANNVAVVMIGVNDGANPWSPGVTYVNGSGSSDLAGVGAKSWQGWLTWYLDDLRAGGFNRIVVGTLTPNNGELSSPAAFQTARGVANVWLRGLVAAGKADAIIDFGKDDVIGNPGNFNPLGIGVPAGGDAYDTGSQWFIDYIHPSQAGHTRMFLLAAPILNAQAIASGGTIGVTPLSGTYFLAADRTDAKMTLTPDAHTATPVAASNAEYARVATPVAGKQMIEFDLASVPSGNNGSYSAIAFLHTTAAANVNVNGAGLVTGLFYANMFSQSVGSGLLAADGASNNWTRPLVAGQKLCMAVDTTAGKGWISNDAGAHWGRANNADPAAGTLPDFHWTPGSVTGQLYFAIALYAGQTSSPVVTAPTSSAAAAPSGFTKINA